MEPAAAPVPAPAAAPAARAWAWLAAVTGLVLVALHLVVRLSSGFGWVGVFQFLAVAPWLVIPFVPVALHVTRRSVATDLPTRIIVALGIGAFLVSAVTLDVADSWGECFLGSCREPASPGRGGTPCRWSAPPPGSRWPCRGSRSASW